MFIIVLHVSICCNFQQREKLLASIASHDHQQLISVLSCLGSADICDALWHEKTEANTSPLAVCVRHHNDRAAELLLSHTTGSTLAANERYFWDGECCATLIHMLTATNNRNLIKMVVEKVAAEAGQDALIEYLKVIVWVSVVLSSRDRAHFIQYDHISLDKHWLLHVVLIIVINFVVICLMQ